MANGWEKVPENISGCITGRIGAKCPKCKSLMVYKEKENGTSVFMDFTAVKTLYRYCPFCGADLKVQRKKKPVDPRSCSNCWANDRGICANKGSAFYKMPIEEVKKMKKEKRCDMYGAYEGDG